MPTEKLAFHVKALTIICRDHRRSGQFYEQVLGAVPMLLDEPTVCLWYRLGTLAITFVPNAAERSNSSISDQAINMLWLEVDDLQEAERHFARHKVEVIQPSDGQMLIIADPDGLPIEVWQRDEKNDEPA
jgi:catechol-2,3-dioxygenase